MLSHWSKTLLPLTVLYILPIYGTILRLSCKEVGNFSLIKENFVLKGSYIAAYASTTEADCEHNCLVTNQCKSINFEKESQTCELNAKSVITTTAADNFLVRNVGWVYKTTDNTEHLVGENCQTMNPCRRGEICTDTCECLGYQCVPGFKDCNEAKDAGYQASGMYKITNHEFHTEWLPVYCDMVTDGGGWIVFQRRIDNSVDFFKTWDKYVKGFGNKTGNFWLGLDYLHTLAAPGKGAVLQIDLKHRSNNNKVYAYYNKFEIGNATDGYRLKIEEYSGNAGDSLAFHNGMEFSTQDKGRVNCANKFKGAWWYNKCHHSNLNGLYPPSTTSNDPKYMSWVKMGKDYGNIMFSEMKLRYP